MDTPGYEKDIYFLYFPFEHKKSKETNMYGEHYRNLCIVGLYSFWRSFSKFFGHPKVIIRLNDKT